MKEKKILKIRLKECVELECPILTLKILFQVQNKKKLRFWKQILRIKEHQELIK